jgi:hypothetical protein
LVETAGVEPAGGVGLVDPFACNRAVPQKVKNADSVLGVGVLHSGLRCESICGDHALRGNVGYERRLAVEDAAADLEVFRADLAMPPLRQGFGFLAQNLGGFNFRDQVIQMKGCHEGLLQLSGVEHDAPKFILEKNGPL